MTWHEEERKNLLGLERLKMDLAERLQWPYLENLSWFQTWPGGWCFHGRASRITPQDSQQSMNFELPPAVHSPSQSIKLAIRKVKENPKRLEERVRWYCEEHSWEVLHPRGVMVAGCPTCGQFKCEVIKQGADEE